MRFSLEEYEKAEKAIRFAIWKAKKGLERPSSKEDWEETVRVGERDIGRPLIDLMQELQEGKIEIGEYRKKGVELAETLREKEFLKALSETIFEIETKQKEDPSITAHWEPVQVPLIKAGTRSTKTEPFL